MIKDLLKEMHSTYQESVGLDPEASYLFGNPILPVVPLDHTPNYLFILGAYPSARFMYHQGTRDVPVDNNLGPFKNERWFDGLSVREQKSAAELRDLFLDKIGIVRGQCWITDLVKVFLFKDGHARKYKELGYEIPAGYERNRFHELGEKSVRWIEKELVIARPKLVITLGAEVAEILRGVTDSAKQSGLLKPEVEKIRIGSIEVPAIHCTHLGILMRTAVGEKWRKRHEEEFIPAIKKNLGLVS